MVMTMHSHDFLRVAAESSSPPSPPRVVVVGGGISGLAAAERLSNSADPIQVLLLEGSDRLGGIVRTERVDDLVIEHGPDVALVTKPAITQLARQVGISSRFISANPAGAFVGTRRGLRRLPPGMSGIVPRDLSALRASRILTRRGYARVEAERRVPPEMESVDESIESCVVRRVGRAW